ncbi:hypothetical protein Clacol_000769 [Clathrus columnatus]|uniref:Metallo-beta-lactamase domain-containing protein n=1 Tax=Clathrus columnatus TaxID=1419009 RepID=A0AAV5A1V9_9AGAM|nr:hypothetical protein Clacol_000769 [Clathrus columnatus]
MSEAKLETVDKLTLQIVVDNNVEWMNPLPPGFIHEVPQHVLSNPPPDIETGSNGIVDIHNYCCGAHGLSVLIRTSKDGINHTTLFDTGPDPRSFVRNYASLGLDSISPTIERIIISHYHGDHTGALPTAVKHLVQVHHKPVIVDLHPDRPIARAAPFAGQQNGLFRLPYDPTFEEISGAGGTLEFHAEEHVVADGAVYVSGEIPRVTEFEIGMPGHMKWVESKDGSNSKGNWEDDPYIMEERYVAIDVTDKGIVILSACSHAGIVNVVRHATERFKKPIYMVLGGMHLGGLLFRSRLQPTVEYLSKGLNPPPKYVVPLHCSGSDVKFLLHQAFGDGCVNIGSGVKIDI